MHTPLVEDVSHPWLVSVVHDNLRFLSRPRRMTEGTS